MNNSFLKIRTRAVGDVTILDIEGEVTAQQKVVLEERATYFGLEDSPKKVLINLSGVQRFDELGVYEFVKMYSPIEERGGRVAIFGLNRELVKRSKVGLIAKIFDLIRIYDDEVEALEAFSFR